MIVPGSRKIFQLFEFACITSLGMTNVENLNPNCKIPIVIKKVAQTSASLVDINNIKICHFTIITYVTTIPV